MVRRFHRLTKGGSLPARLEEIEMLHERFAENHLKKRIAENQAAPSQP